jgi:hypothetical protein
MRNAIVHASILLFLAASLQTTALLWFAGQAARNCECLSICTGRVAYRM